MNYRVNEAVGGLVNSGSTMGPNRRRWRSISLSSADHTGPLMKTLGVRRHGTTMAVILLGLFLSTACAYGQQHHTGDDMQTTTKSSPSAQGNSGMAAQADAFFDNYRFRDGEILPRLRIHYSALGSPHRNTRGQIDNAVLVIHWTGADGKTLLSKNYMEEETSCAVSPGDREPQPRTGLLLRSRLPSAKTRLSRRGFRWLRRCPICLRTSNGSRHHVSHTAKGVHAGQGEQSDARKGDGIHRY
jgi:hypothetical protein